jgi:hypothetical protein
VYESLKSAPPKLMVQALRSSVRFTAGPTSTAKALIKGLQWLAIEADLLKQAYLNVMVIPVFATVDQLQRQYSPRLETYHLRLVRSNLQDIQYPSSSSICYRIWVGSKEYGSRRTHMVYEPCCAGVVCGMA